MRRSAGRMFIRGFIKSFFILSFILGVGILSYNGVMHFFDIRGEDAVVAFKQQPGFKAEMPSEVKPEAEYMAEASIDDISKNLIFCYDDKSGEINNILLEIYRCEDKKLYYITIPMRTQFTMSDLLYQKLSPSYPSIPQIFTLSSISTYFSNAYVYDYGVLLIEDFLGIKISYYTAIPASIYKTIFTTEVTKAKDLSKQETVQTVTHAVNDTSGTVSKEVFTNKYIKFLKSLKTKEDIKKYIRKIYPSIQSNLPLDGKLEYLDSYYNTPIDNVSFDLIKGVDLNSAFTINSMLAQAQIEACLNN